MFEIEEAQDFFFYAKRQQENIMEPINQNNQFDSEEIDLSEIFVIIKRNILIILVSGLVLGILAFSYTKFAVKKQYVSSGTLIVNNRKSESNSVTNDEITSAKNLASVYSIVIKSEPILNQVLTNLKLDTTENINTDQLSKLITVSSVDATQVMKVSVKTKDPKLSEQIANEVLKVSPEIIEETVEAGSVKVISQAKVNENAVSPNVIQNTLIAIILGFMLSVGAVLVINLLDKTFKDEEDIEKYLGLPLLGVIPNVDSVKGANK